MFLEILIAVAASAAFTVALLLLARSRLNRQFQDVQRRLVEVERTAYALRTGVERSTTTSQLERLHLGLVRLHEDVAERFGPLLPLAVEMTERGPARNHLSEYQISGLRDWASRLGVPLEQAQIGGLSRAIGQFEASSGLKSAIATEELLAIVVALLPLRGQCGVRLGVTGGSAAVLVPLLSSVVSGFLDRAEVFAIRDDADCDVMIAGGEAPQPDSLKKGGTLVTFGAADEGEFPPGLELVAAEWNVQVYRKPTS